MMPTREHQRRDRSGLPRAGHRGLGLDSGVAPTVSVSLCLSYALIWHRGRIAPLIHGHLFEANLPDPRLTMREGEGHLQRFSHLADMLGDL